MSSATLQKGLKIVINAAGLVSHTSKRNMIDGFVYFGRKKAIKKGTHDPNAETTAQPVIFTINNIFQKQIVNDFIIPSKNA